MGILLLQHNYGTASWLDCLAESVKVFADVIIYFQTRAAKDFFHHLHLNFSKYLNELASAEMISVLSYLQDLLFSTTLAALLFLVPKDSNYFSS